MGEIVSKQEGSEIHSRMKIGDRDYDWNKGKTVEATVVPQAAFYEIPPDSIYGTTLFSVHTGSYPQPQSQG